MSMRQNEDAHAAMIAAQHHSHSSLESKLGSLDISDAGGDSHGLGEGHSYNASNINQPLMRNVVASVRASLSELCNSRAKATWSPSADSLGAIFQQRQFTDLSGAAIQRGDLKNTVLHSVQAKAIKSTFPLSLGVDITGVDAQTYSHTGQSYSQIVLPRVDTTVERTLQEDDPQVAYDFMARYPGYTAHNLETNGVHAVPQRRFVLVSAEHPLMQAIKDNAAQLQASDFSEMPEGLVKMNTSLYEAVMPVVRAQVESQVRVRDFSKFSVSISPSDHASWQSAMETLTAEATKPLKVDRQRALAQLGKDDIEGRAKVNAKFDDLEHVATNKVQSTPLEFHIEAQVKYNFMSA